MAAASRCTRLSRCNPLLPRGLADPAGASLQRRGPPCAPALSSRTPSNPRRTKSDGRGVERLDGTHRVALDAWHLHQTADRVAGEAEVVLHADLCGVLDLHRGAAEYLAERPGGHGARRADLALTADLGTRDR